MALLSQNSVKEYNPCSRLTGANLVVQDWARTTLYLDIGLHIAACYPPFGTMASILLAKTKYIILSLPDCVSSEYHVLDPKQFDTIYRCFLKTIILKKKKINRRKK